MRIILLLLAATLAGCVSYAKVERTTIAGEKCRAVARGYFFTFQTPGVIEECRDQEDR